MLAGLAAVGAVGVVESASANTPTPRDPLDAQIEESQARLKKIQADKPKQKILDDLNRQIEAELNPQKPPAASDPRDAKIAELEKQHAETRQQLDNFKKTIASDPNVKVFTDAQLRQYIDSGVEVALKAKEAETATQRAGDASKRAKEEQDIVVAKADAEAVKSKATTEAAVTLQKAQEQAAAMQGKINLPYVGETDERVALGGAAVAGGLVGRVLRPIGVVKGAVGLYRRLRSGAAPAAAPDATTAAAIPEPTPAPAPAATTVEPATVEPAAPAAPGPAAPEPPTGPDPTTPPGTGMPPVV